MDTKIGMYKGGKTLVRPDEGDIFSFDLIF
jgi:hypothetical protein